MALVRLNIGQDDGEVRLHRSGQAAAPALCNAARRGNGPIVVMLHGYKYDPARPDCCPQDGLFSSDAPDGWPAQLGLSHDDDALAVTFGWGARGRVAEAFEAAQDVGRKLAQVIDMLRVVAPHRRINMIAHSMGAEVALSAIRHAGAGSIARVVLLTGASFTSHARAALNSPAGYGAELLNVISRENDLFDFALEQLVRPSKPGDRSLGAGIDAPNAVSMQLDCDATLTALSRLGVQIAPSQRRICHWSSYTRSGAMAFYARFMCAPETLPLNALRAALPKQSHPRWWRLAPEIPFKALGLRLKPTKPILPESFAKTS